MADLTTICLHTPGTEVRPWTDRGKEEVLTLRSLSPVKDTYSQTVNGFSSRSRHTRALGADEGLAAWGLEAGIGFLQNEL